MACKGRDVVFWLERQEPMRTTEYGRFRIASAFAAEFPDYGLRIEVEVTDGIAEIAAIRRLAGAPALTVTWLKTRKLDTMLREALRFTTFELVRVPTKELAENVELKIALGDVTPDEGGCVAGWLPLYWRAATHEAETVHARSRARRGTRLTDEVLQRVADVYLGAAGKDPRIAVAKDFVITPSAASKRITKAEQGGFLPATSKGRVRRPG